MRIGEEVTYNGRCYAVVGFTPISVRPFQVELFDQETAESLWIEWPQESDQPAALRLAPENDRAPAD
jgi:hypothetical protein